jgi:hypothetical protein
VDHEAEKRGIASVRMRQFFVMRFLTEMEMRRDGVLEKVHEHVSGENKNEDEGGAIVQPESFRETRWRA